MAYVQANILLTAPCTTPSDELFKRASSFQESLEAELKTYYKMEDACRYPEYLEELLALLTSYYEGVLGMAGASGVTVPRAWHYLALPRSPIRWRTPRQRTPLTNRPPRRRPPHRRGPPARRSPRRRRPHPRPGAKEESAGAAAVANKSCCA